MALNDKDILITPNKGSGVNDPKIDFVGADASTSGTITVTALAANSGTVSFGGYRGPILQIINTGTVAVKVLNTGNSVSTTTGALQVVGGVGIQQDLYVGGLIYGNLANSSANIQVSNDNASTTPQYITFVSTSTGSTPLKVGAPNGLAFIPSSGFYSIGTANPRSPLVVRKDGTNINGNWYEVIRATNAAQTKGISLGYDNGSATGIVAADATTGATNLAFWTYDATIPLGWGERVRINSTGQLLVGTSNVPANTQVNAAFVGPIGYDGGVAVSNWNGGGAALTSYGGAGLQLYTFTGNIGSEVSTERLRVDSNGYFFINTGAQLNTGFNNRLNVLGSIAVGTGTSVNGSIMLQSYTGARGAYTNLGTEKTSGGPVLSYAAYPGNTASTFVSAITGAASARSALVLSDTIRFFTGASANIGQNQRVQTSEVLRVDNLGKLGIGTNAPGYQLEVFADSPNTIVASNASSGVTQEAGYGYSIDGSLLWTTLVDNGDSNKWKLRYNNTSEYLTVDVAGNVGVGTTAPSQTLSVAGTLGIGETGSTGGRLQLTSTAAGAVIFQNDNSPIIFKTLSGTQEKMRITDGGRVGIGIATPNTNVSLDVLGSIQTGGSLTIGDGGYLTTGTIYSSSLYGMAFRAKTYYPSQAAFTFISGTGTEYVRISPYGNVGIGTSNPAVLLEVNKNGAGNGTAQEIARFVNSAAGATSSFMYIGATTGVDWKLGKNVLGTASRLNFDITDSSNNLRLTIDSSGNVGIGTGSPGSALHVSGQSRISGTNARLTLEPAGGGTTNLFNIDNSSGTLRIFREDYAASGTGANGAVRLTISDSGNVVINSGYLQTINGLVDVGGTGSALRVLSPGGASFAAGAATQTGAIKIRLPQGYTDTMMRMTVKVYTYDGLSYEIVLGGYNYPAGPSWINTFAYMVTRNRGSLNVRFGHDGTYNCIFIGETSTIWSYPQVFVTDFQAGYSNYGIAQWNTGWNVSFYSGTAFANTSGGQFVTSTITVYPAWTTGSLTSLSQLVNDVPYISAGGMVNDYVPKWDGAKFVNSQLYSTGTNVGVSTTSPQATLDVNGITLFRNGSTSAGGGPAYQIRFGYNNTDTFQHYIRTRHNGATAVDNAFDFYTSDGTSAGTFASNKVLGMTINGGSVGVGNVTTPSYTLHVQGTGYSSTSFRTPIYYDHDNTAYYVDGNNTSILNTLLVNGGTYNGAATSGVTRSYLDSNGSFFSYYAAEASPRIQLGRDIGVSGGAGLALGGSSYALIGTNDTAGTNLYIRVNTSVGGVTTSPQVIVTATGLGIKTTPSAPLHVNAGTAGVIAYFEGTSGRYIYTGVDGGHYIEQVGTSAAERVLRIQNSNGSGTYTQLFWDGANQKIYTSNNASFGVGNSLVNYKLHVAGTGFASDDFRAPRFYDSDNTNFYLDPASTSVLNGITANSLSVSGSFSVSGDFSANRYNWSGPTATTLYNLNVDPNMAILFDGAKILGDGPSLDLLAFNPPTISEYSANGTSGWTSTPVVADMFRGMNSMRFNSNYTLTTSQLGVRFTWNSFGYKFWQGLIVSGSTQGDSISIQVEGSTNGSTWTVLLAETNIGGNWPGYNYVRHITNNSGNNPYLRITIRKLNLNANPVYLGNISMPGSYGGGTRLFDWDASRTITMANHLYVQGTYYDNANSAYYVKPSGVSRLNTLYVSDGNNGKILWDDYYHGIVLRGYPTNATTGIATGDVVSFMEYSGDFRFYQHNGTVNNLLFQVAAGGIGYAFGSMRSPIFYNYTDTAYYVDPEAAVSANFGGSVNAATYNYAGLRVNSSGSSSAGAAFAIQQVTSEGWTGIFVDYEPYTGWGFYHDNPNNYFLITAESTGGSIGSNTVPSRVSGNRTAHTKFLFDQNTGDGYAGGSFRAPIFYNYTDTSYYVDANSTSRLYNLQVANFITDGPSVNGRIFLYGNLHIDSFNGNDIYLNYYSSRRVRAYYGSNVESFRTDLDGIVYAFNQFRTPLIYDLDNTGFYVDPASTTRLNTLLVNNLNISSQQGGGNYPIGHYSSGDYVFEIDPTWSNAQLQTYFNSGSVSWVADSTAPGGYAIQIVGGVNVGGVYGSGFPFIPVEVDDAFYCEVWIKNTSSSGTFHYMGSIDFNESFGSLGGNPGSFGYWTMIGNNPGAVGTWTKFTGYVTGFGVGGIGTFRTGTKYFTPQALFNYNGGNCYISGWKFTRIQNRGRRQVGVFPNSTLNTAEAWYGRAADRNQGTFTVQLGGNSPTSRSFEVVDYNWTTVLGSIGSDGISYASNSYRAPAFYDRDNPAYFLNPAGTDSYLNGGTAVGTWNFTSGSYAAYMHGNGNTASVAGIGLNVYSTGGNGAVMAFHRGSQYAVNMGLDSDNVFRIGGWSAGPNRLQLDMSSNLTLLGGVYAPAFYDQDSTFYFVNPAGLSRIGGIQISAADAGTAGNGIRFYGISGDGNGAYNHTALIERQWRNGDESELLIFKGNDPDTGGIHDRIRIAATGRIVFHSTNSYGNVDDYISTSGTGNINGSGYVFGGEWYLPIIRDMDDPTYYFDGNGTTNIKYLKVNTDGSSSASRALTIRQTGTGEINFGSYPGAWTSALQIQDNSASQFMWMSPLSSVGYGMLFHNTYPIYFYGSGGFAGGAFSGSLRSPIFYDHDDTTYYMNPATETYLYGGIWNNGGHGNSSIKNRLLAGQNGAGTGEVRLQQWCSEPGNSWDWAGFGYNVDNNSNSSAPAYYFGRPNPSFGQAYMRMSPDGQWYFYTANRGGTRYTNMYMAPNSGVEVYGRLYSDSRMDAPIYYDANDTGYYADFNSTSNSAMRVRGGTLYGPNPTWGEYLQVGGNGDNGTWAQVVTTNGNLHLDGRRGGYGIYLQWYNGGPVYVENRIDATIFYDRNNTGYYTDPASYSNMNEGNFAGRMWYSNYLVSRNNGGLMGDYNVNGTASKVIWTIGESWPLGNMYGIGYEYAGTAFLPSDPHVIAIRYNGGTNTRLQLNGGIWTNGNIYTPSAFYGPIYYDTENTGYYTNPATTSYMNAIQGGRYSVGWANPYDQVSNSPWYGLGQSDAGGPWGPGMVQLGGYYGIRNRTAHGVFDISAPGWGTSWIFSDFNIASSGQMRSAIFYDYNNTGFYSDLNGDTNWQGLTDYGKMRIGLTSRANFRRNDYTGDQNYWIGSMGWGTTDMNSVAGWGSGFIDSWGNPANQPSGTSHWVGTQAFHYAAGGNNNTGWQLVGGPISNLRFRSAWSGWSGWTTVAMHDRNDYSGGALYAGIYYDSNNTGYYDDPASTSRLNQVESNRTYGFDDIRSPIFYNYSDTGWYCDPNSESNLFKPTYYTQQNWSVSYRAVGRSRITGDQNHWTNTVGWGTSYGTWDTFWEHGGGFFECWGGGTGHPQGGGYIHAQGIQSGLHYATSGGGSAYGWQMVGAADATANRYWARGKWGGGISGWREFVMSDSNPGYTLYSYIMYDANNTGYYCDPNGYSQMSSGEFNNYLRSSRLTFTGEGGNSGNGTHAYAIFQEGGGWGFPFPDLRIAFHTGIKFGANPSYEGMRFYTDYDMGGRVMQINGGSNYIYMDRWMNVQAGQGMYSGENGAHFYPNNGTYGAWKIDGSRNGWRGIEFQDGLELMMNYNAHGIHRNDTGWMFYSESRNFYVPGDVTAYWSDRRLKKNIKPLEKGSGLALVSKLVPSSFQWNDTAASVYEGFHDGQEETSLIAQEVQEILPIAVVENKSGRKVGKNSSAESYLTVKYDKITPYLIQAIKDLQAEVEELREIIKNGSN
jgi:hypothetical protein